MKYYFRRLLVLAVLSSAVAGCATTETQFANSSYGIEMESMMTTCMEMQQSGLLPGIEAGEGKLMRFESGKVDFSKRNEVVYPLRLNCIITQNDQDYSFPFIKQFKTSQWKLS